MYKRQDCVNKERSVRKDYVNNERSLKNKMNASIISCVYAIGAVRLIIAEDDVA